MRRIHGYCLAVLTAGVLGYWAFNPAFSAYSPGDSPPATKPAAAQPAPGQATPEQCQADAYSTPPAEELKYRYGDLVTNVEHAFSCKEAGWCNQGPYAPGVPFNGQEIWKDAWTDLGACPSGPQANTLKLSFATVTGEVPFKTTVKGVGPQPQRNLQVTGLLRCKDEEIPFSTPADQELTLSDLKPCRYDLIVNEAQGYLPLNTPTRIEFTEGKPEKISLDVKFRQPLDLNQLITLPGVKVEVFASGISQPRQMVMGNNVLYVGSSAIPNYSYDYRIAGFIYAIPLENGKPKGIYLIDSDLEEPHGVAYRDGTLYYSTTGKLYRVPDVDNNYRDPHREEVFSFPPDEGLFPLPHTGVTRIWHMKHPLQFNPHDKEDDGLYTAVGVPCNLCMIPADPRYGSILRYDLGTGQARVVADGVRNSVGLAWAKDGKLWFSDNNRQGFPNDDEINRIDPQGNTHFGVPYFFGRDTPGFTQQEYLEPGSAITPPLVSGAIVSDRPLHQLRPEDYQPPAYGLGSNTAPLGLTFWQGMSDGSDELEHLVVAVHGTGTPSSPGMELRMLTVEDGSKVVNQIPLVTGWASPDGNFDVYCLDGSCLGRPADVLQLDDNSLLVSDDLASVIYRITFDSAALKTWLYLQPTEAPAPAVAPLMISGTLVDEQSRSRRFDVAWGATPMKIRGLAPGKYTINLNDVGDYVPVARHQQITLDDSPVPSTINLSYIERPPFEPIKVTLVAPEKPAGSDAGEQWEVNLVSDGKPMIVKVPWGAREELRLSLGKHAFNFPYYQNSLPVPNQEVVNVEEQGMPPVTVQMHYQQVPELGKHLVATSCAICHTVQYFQDANKAINWSLAGRDALIQQIRGMSVIGHCDASCAGQIADYLNSDLWAEYLEPGNAYGKRQVRLLTRDEYVNSVRDLFGVELQADELPANKFDRHFKYPGEADRGVIQSEDLKTLYDVAWKVAQAADDRVANLSVETLGHRVFRRPLTSDERSRYERLLAEHDRASLVAAMLLSPYFLYRSELGVAAGKEASYPLTANERATALSYTLLGTTPSDELMRQAEQGQLETPAQIGAAAEQLLKSPQGAVQFNRFISYYLKTDRGSQEKPGLSEDVVKSMQAEQAKLVQQVIADGGSFEALFNPGYTFVDKGLAQHYGLPSPTGDGMQRVTVDAKRGGLLHLGITQAANSDYQATSLVKRGIMIREQLLCREFGAPVDADPVEPQYPPRAISTRERWDMVNGEQASEGRCWQCHKYMNDTGSSMEHYDAAGRYRDQEQAYNHAQYPVNVPINAAGPFISNTGAEEWGPVGNVRDIARLLPGSSTAQTCMADSYFRFMFGNKVSAGSVGTLKSASQTLNANGSLIQMIRELATSPVFLNRHEEN
ncbi:DUF1592 domain-containing protein [Pseudomonas xanthosomatis]|uniref:DUF1592 domain-containing protein n=1 Tax=Pseudomonas xanthosomatis TaxID=2842356 RepID=UPI001C3E7398|nr:DUF1592 domain-containing protein [Pseudomonas xanthosomatis]QXH47323.1 DUF1592 domain-containing protein [Pseudomonas xanthosomatis]